METRKNAALPRLKLHEAAAAAAGLSRHEQHRVLLSRRALCQSLCVCVSESVCVCVCVIPLSFPQSFVPGEKKLEDLFTINQHRAEREKEREKREGERERERETQRERDS